MWRPRFNRTLIIHANVYDQDQGLTGRYQNTTLDTNQNNTSFILQARGLEVSNTLLDTQESAEATISEYAHKLNKSSLRRLAQKHLRSKRQGLLRGSLLTTPGRRRSSRSSRHPRGSSSRHKRWRLDPGLRHLVASTGKRKKGGKGGAKQPWVLIQSTRKQGSTLHMQHYQREAVYVDWAAEMPA